MRVRPFPATVVPLVLTTLVAAMAFRYRVVEPSAVGLLCDSGAGPWWCALRGLGIGLFTNNLLGLGSLAAGVLSHWMDRRGLAAVALVLGAAGLVLYEADTAAAGVVIGLLRAVRP